SRLDQRHERALELAIGDDDVGHGAVAAARDGSGSLAHPPGIREEGSEECRWQQPYGQNPEADGTHDEAPPFRGGVALAPDGRRTNGEARRAVEVLWTNREPDGAGRFILRMKHPTGALTQAKSRGGIRDRPSPRGGYRLPPALASVMPPNPAAIPTRLESPMRNPTPADAELLMRLYEIRRDPELRRARQWFLTEFKATEWSQIKAGYLKFADEDRWFRMTTSYWE